MTSRLRAFGGWLYRISDRVVIALVLGAFLAAPFYRTELVRHQLLGGAPPATVAALPVLCVALALASRSLLRRDFVWLDPARLTWSDFTDRRVGQLGRRLWAGWLVRYAAAAYVAAVAVVVLDTTPAARAWLPAGAALAGGVALFAVLLGRRPSADLRWLEPLLPLGLAGVAGVATQWPVHSGWLWVLGAAGVLLAVAASFGAGPLRRPRVASTAGRLALVRRYRERAVRRAAIGFLDPLALLPPGRPLPWARVLAGRFVVLRFVLAGALTRAPALVLSALLVCAVAVLHQVFPLLSPVLLVGVGAYFAVLPFAAATASLWRIPGLRRWLGCTDLELRATTAGLVALGALAWLALATCFGLPWSVRLVLVALLAGSAVVRTVSRPPLDYGNVGVTVTPDGNMVPFGLVLQLVRGPELLAVGLVLLAVGFTPPMTATLVLALVGYGVLR